MTRAAVMFLAISLVLLFLVLTLATAHVPQPPPALRSPAHFRFPLIPEFSITVTPSAKGKGYVLEVGTPRPGKIPEARFSSKQDALAAEKLLREALQWADPKVRVMAPPAR